ncbi:MAG: TIGR04211 family SH3 domain-containing protein, partial [Proteobacteria bacterium]|nr:TIGR04211 family SH3 domain-containing protein [Pseudomonadota bacterium]
MSKAFIALVFNLLIYHQVCAETLYVSDVLRITVRTGPTTTNEILETISSGTQLETTGEEADGWVSVRTPKGTEGYALSRYLVNEPIAKDQLAEMRAQLQRLQAEPDSIASNLLQMDNENLILASQNDELSREVQQIAEQLALIEEDSSDVFAVVAEADELRKERDRLILALDESRMENAVFEDQSDK